MTEKGEGDESDPQAGGNAGVHTRDGGVRLRLPHTH